MRRRKAQARETRRVQECARDDFRVFLGESVFYYQLIGEIDIRRESRLFVLGQQALKDCWSAESFSKGPAALCFTRRVFYPDEKVAHPEIFPDSFKETILA